MVPCWNKPTGISDPSRCRRSTVLKLFYFIMRRNKIISENGRSSLARSVAQAPAVAWKACCSPSRSCRRRHAGACRRRLAITVDKCCDWLQQLPHEYSKIGCRPETWNARMGLNYTWQMYKFLHCVPSRDLNMRPPANQSDEQPIPGHNPRKCPNVWCSRLVWNLLHPASTR